jgi:hypothetical protein
MIGSSNQHFTARRTVWWAPAAFQKEPMMRTWSLCVLFLAALLPISKAATNNIVPGQTLCDSLPGGEQDVFVFTASDGDSVSIAMSRNSNLLVEPRLRLRLLAPDGSEFAEATHSYAAYLQTFRLTHSGVFQIVCQDENAVDNSPYCLTLLKNPGPNTAEQGETNTIAAGQTRSGNISARGDLDVYRFDGTAGDFISVAMARNRDFGDSFLDPYIEVWAPDGTIEATTAGHPYPRYAAYLQGHRLEQSGSYLIVCRDDERYYMGAYNLTLVKNPGPNAADAGETDTIAAGQTRSGTISRSADLDVYSYDGTAGDFISVAMSRVGISSLAPYVELWAPDGTIEATAGRYLRAHRLEQSGRYVIVCYDDERYQTGPYDLTVVKNPGPNLADAGETDTIAAGQTRSGTISGGGDVDVYSYEGTAGDLITLAMSRIGSPYIGSSLQPYVELWAPDGTIEATAISGSPYWYSAYLQAHRLQQSGPYLIVCYDRQRFYSAAYELALVKLPGPNVTDADETNMIAAGQTVSGNLSSGADLDVYNYEGTAGDLVTFYMTGASPYIELWAPDGTIEATVERSGGAYAYLQGHRLGQSGLYLLVCYDEYHFFGSAYGLTLVKNPGPNAADPGEHNAIVAGQTLSGEINGPADLDVYSYDGIAGDSISLATSASGIELWAPDGTIEAAAWGWPTYLRAHRLQQNGRYLIVCSGSGGAYNLTLLKNPGPNATDAGETNRIAAGQTLSGNIGDAADMDVYIYDGTAGNFVTLAMSSAVACCSLYPYVELWAPDGTIEATAVGADWIYPNAAYLHAHKLQQSGPYLLVCYGLNHGPIGDYNLTLLQNPGPNATEAGETNTAAATRNGSIFGGADMDAYTFEAAAGDSILVQLAKTSGYLNPHLDLWTPNGEVLQSVQGNLGMGADSVATFYIEYLPLSGTYLLVCRDHLGYFDGSYTLFFTQRGSPLPTNAPPEFLQTVISFRTNRVVVRWSTNAVGYHLQSTEDLINWSNVPPPYGGFGGFYFVTNSIPPYKKFFRLVKP